MSRWARATEWIALLTGALVVLRLTATGALAAPPISSADGVIAWVETRDPATTALALVRLAAEVASWYLLGLSLLHLPAALGGRARAGALAERLTVPGVGPLLRGALGVGLVVAPSPGGADPDVAGTAIMRPLDDAPTTDPPAAGTAAMVPGGPVDAPAERSGDGRVIAAPTTWRVEAGDSFWSIAGEILHDAWRRPPTDTEIDPFWRRLVEVNGARLVLEGDPDLVIPGQVFEVPPLPAPR